MYHQFSSAFINAMGSPTEMAVIIFAVILLFGAKSLPGTLRTLGKWMEQLRQISRDVQREIIDAERPLEDARKAWENEIKDLTVSADTRRPHRLEAPKTDSGDAATAPPETSEGEIDPAPQKEVPHDG